MRRSKKGVTLVELIIVSALVIVVMSLGLNLLLFGNKAQAVSTDEYELQTAARIASETTNKIVRYSTAVFTINESSFREDNLTAGWNYFGISPDKTEIVQYTYDAVNKTHIKTAVISAQTGMTYRLRFWKNDKSNDNKLLSFAIEAIKDGSAVKKIDIDTQLEALNSLQVIDRSTLSDPATALAYRSDERPMAIYGAISMVLDRSGSMDWDIYGNNTYTESNKRISILRTEAAKLVNAFAKEQNISISLAPFSTSGNSVGPFYSAANETSSLLGSISGLSANGGTNTGDGMRRGYYQIVNFNLNHSDITCKNYMIILVDGVTTYYTWKNGNYYLAAGGISESYDVEGFGGSLDPDGTRYVDRVGSMIRSYANGIKTYVIGFSANHDDLGSIQDIADAAGTDAGNVYQYASDRDLGVIFEAIRKDILNDLWVINGPAR
ncbi:MAG: vWA domain-containing protein [Clostridiaceae bacterium]|nr:vWA domain-containing protein [Clostridiaceae bacterium]